MQLHFPLGKSRHVTIISTNETKELFYENLDQLKSTPAADKLLILGDFNARVGKDHDSWKGMLGPHGVGYQNMNGSSF